MLYLVVSSATTAARAGIVFGRCGATLGCSELCYGKGDRTEEIAGAITALHRSTLLVGNTVIARVDEKLCRALESDYRENSKGYVQTGSVCCSYDFLAETAFETLGDIGILTATTGASAVAITNLRAENNRLNGLDDRGRLVGQLAAGAGLTEACAVGGIGDCATFSTVEDDFLFEGGETAEGLALPYPKAGFKFYLDIIAYRNAVKSAVEGHVVNTDVSSKELRCTCSDIGCARKDFFSAGSEINSCILEAISIAATVKNSFSVYANRRASGGAVGESARKRCVSVFLHFFDHSL